ncbi:MAG TPA: GMC family oxidoreductase [Spongiibacteraceae bacterium]|nr:GMC family oxidoreductase [Spongiibacteraceae bacterium]
MSSINSIQTFDYIVVGGGSAGCTVAGRLAEANVGRVLLLEAGGKAESNPETLSADGFKYTFANDALMIDRMSEPQSTCGNRTVYSGSGRGMGGSGSVNGMVYTRGDKLDYAQWPAGWHWEDVETAFQQLEQRLRVRHRTGTKFTEIALDAAEAAGFKRKNRLNDGNLSGFMGYNDMNFEADNRRSSYVAFIAENDSTNLTVKTKCQVHKILFDERLTAVGVEVEIDGRKQNFMARKEVILSAGALETPKLLMLSGIGPKAHLESLGIPVLKDVASIGSNLQDHLNVTMFFRGRQPVDFGYPQLYGFYRCNKGLDLPALQADTCFAWISLAGILPGIIKRSAPATVLRGKQFFNPFLNALVRHTLTLLVSLPGVKRFINNLYGIAVILGKPVSRGTLRLASRNAKDPALVDLAYFQDSADMETILKGVELTNKIAAHSGLQAWGNQAVQSAALSNNRPVLEKWARSSAVTTFHYCGTCSMGEDVDSPVDTQLRLKGFSNIRIADASVFPVVPVSALNAPSMMVGFRAADFILTK